MNVHEILFSTFGIFSIACAAGVVFSRSPVYSAFSLILSFFGLSAMYVLWDATFIAMIQILIYTGAIVVLFVFVVMLLDLGHSAGGYWHSWFTVVFAGFGTWCLGLFLLRSLNSGNSRPIVSLGVNTGMREISRLLFTDYLWPFEVLSLFMLAMLIAVYALARPETPDGKREH